LGSRGADVACATTGEEAVLRLHGVAPFHVAIIDAALKGKVTGRGFAAHVGSKGTAVLFTLQGEKAQAPEPCGAPLLMKPFQLSALDDAVDRLLGTPGAPEDGAAAAPA
jgi:CheY-like chemotaxis protein